MPQPEDDVEGRAVGLALDDDDDWNDATDWNAENTIDESRLIHQSSPEDDEGLIAHWNVTRDIIKFGMNLGKDLTDDQAHQAAMHVCVRCSAFASRTRYG